MYSNSRKHRLQSEKGPKLGPGKITLWTITWLGEVGPSSWPP